MPPKKPRLTHFLCLPLTNDTSAQWQESLHKFTADIQSLQILNFTPRAPPATVLSTSAASQIPSRAIRPLGTLHLTLGVMSLTTPEKIDGATTLLRSLDVAGILRTVEEKLIKVNNKPEAIGSEVEKQKPALDDSRKGSDDDTSQTLSSRPVILSFTGLETMHSPKSTSLLYTPPTDSTDRLYPFCKAVKEYFVQKGLMIEDKRPLKLHATVLNTIYAGKVYPRGSKVNYMKAIKGAEPVSAETISQDEKASNEERHEEENPDHEPKEHEALETQANPPDQIGKKRNRKKRDVNQFDARELLARYADFKWARDVRIEKLAICEMGAKKTIDEEGRVVGEEYTEIAFVAMP